MQKSKLRFSALFESLARSGQKTEAVRKTQFLSFHHTMIAHHEGCTHCVYFLIDPPEVRRAACLTMTSEGETDLFSRTYTVSGVHPASYSRNSGASFSNRKAAGGWSWSRTSIYCWGWLYAFMAFMTDNLAFYVTRPHDCKVCETDCARPSYMSVWMLHQHITQSWMCA